MWYYSLKVLVFCLYGTSEKVRYKESSDFAGFSSLRNLEVPETRKGII